jgi:hypothetical protein
MPHQDHSRATAPSASHQDLRPVLDWLTADADFAAVRFRSVCTWCPRGLVCTALLWAWSDENTLLDRFAAARRIVLCALGLDETVAATYQAFLKLLGAWSRTLVAALVAALRRRLRHDLAERFTSAGFAAFGVDGSQLQLPRTTSHEGRFTARPQSRRRGRPRAERVEAARRKKAECPQLWLTTMLHLGTGLPWDWRLGPKGSSERAHLIEMLDSLPAEALVVADAGFVGYETWRAIQAGGRHLLVRVGANIRLLQELGFARERQGLVCLWPDRVAAAGQPPLVLRLVVVSGPRHPVYLVTSVLEAEVLSDRQVIDLYRQRWGVELFYRHFKQTFARRKLRSHRAENAEVEATWSLVGLWALGLHGQVELACDAVPAARVSIAKLLRAYRGAMRPYPGAPGPGETLGERIARAVLDPYRRASKSSRAYPRKKREQAIGAPQIRAASPAEKERARQVRNAHLSTLTA